MSAKTVHPLFSEKLTAWRRCRDSYDGEDAIKDAGSTYLPPTSGMWADGYGTKESPGQVQYDAYRQRAHYPDIFTDAVEAAIGIMHREPPVIELPTAMESMLEDATLLGESLEMVLRNINTNQLISGRLGLLADLRRDGDTVRPVIVQYNEQTIRNWDDTSVTDEDVDLRLVVLDESGYVMGPTYEWSFENRYRVLGLLGEDGVISRDGTSYGTALLEETQDIAGVELQPPEHLGERLDHIPFVFINSKDLSATPDNPPLDGLSKICLTIYRGEADYRQNLFMQGQDTLVRIGAINDGETVRVGAGARIDVPIGGDAKYIGVNSKGLPEQRQALENDYGRAIRKSGQLLDATSRAKESGDALRIRVAAQTATLPQIAKAGAAGLQRVLRSLAEWIGADPEQVVVTPNLNFTEADLNGQTLVQVLQAKALGAPISNESIHGFIGRQGFTELSFEEELALIASEEPAPGANIPSPLDNEGSEGDDEEQEDDEADDNDA